MTRNQRLFMGGCMVTLGLVSMPPMAFLMAILVGLLVLSLFAERRLW